MRMRIRWEKLGKHIHCRVFTSKTSDGTFANCGSLVFDEEEWPEIARLFRNAEFLEDGK